VNQEPHAAPEPEPSFLAREGPFILASIIGLTYFVVSIPGTLLMNLSPEKSHPLLEQAITHRTIEGTLRALLPLIASAVGLAALLYLAKKRKPLLPLLASDTPRWSLWDFFKVWASSFCFFPLATFLMRKTPFIWGRLSEPATFGFLASGQNVVILLLCLWVARSAGGRTFFSTQGLSRRLRTSFVYGLRGFLLTAPLAFGAGQISGFILSRLGIDRGIDPVSSYLLDVPAAELWILLVAIVLLAPLAEELLYRSFLYPPLEARFGSRAGVLLTGLVFAALHLNPYDFLGLFALGVGLAYTYSRTRSLGACVVFHALINTLSVASVLTLRFLLQ
jgi:membrane protease YdiL (CAAX protease family)